jgi:hypothetical protein
VGGASLEYTCNLPRTVVQSPKADTEFNTKSNLLTPTRAVVLRVLHDGGA